MALPVYVLLQPWPSALWAAEGREAELTQDGHEVTLTQLRYQAESMVPTNEEVPSFPSLARESPPTLMCGKAVTREGKRESASRRWLVICARQQVMTQR